MEIIRLFDKSKNEFRQNLLRYATPRVFLLHGKGSYVSCGAAELVGESLRNAGKEVVEWNEFLPNPKIEDVRVGVEKFLISEADSMVAVGGGSVLDMAKLVRFFSAYQEEVDVNSFIKVRETVPLVAIPTTAGTGSESTPFAVCYKDGIKHSIYHADILPTAALLYPSFTFSNSSYLTACTGFDALAQAIEAYWSINATADSDLMAEKAIKLIMPALPTSVNVPAEQVRKDMLEGANLAGQAIALTRTTAPHAFSYAFTSQLGYPHGHAVAITFPFFFSLHTSGRYLHLLNKKLDENSFKSKMNNLLSLVGIDEATDSLSFWEDYINNIHLGFTARPDTNVRLLVSKVNLQRLANNPIITDENILESLIDYLKGSKKYR